MNRSQHMIVGSIISAGMYLVSSHVLNQEPSLKGFLLSLGVGASVGILPDVLEPATSSYHRSFFHSAAFASLIGYVNYRVMNDNTIASDLKVVLAVASAAYGSHLALDVITPRGLPLLTNSSIIS